MFETAPLIIFLVIILAALIGVVIGKLLSSLSYKDKRNSINNDPNEKFHIDKVTGIVSDASSVKYQR